MKMQDLGMKHKDMAMPEADKNKIHYPSFSVEKDLGIKMGQKVHLEGVVSGLRKDKYGESTSIEVHKCGMMGKMSSEDFEKLDDKDQRKELEKEIEKKGG